MPELKELPKRYPELFKNHPYNKGPAEHYYPFQCGDGWYNILDCLLHNIKQALGRYREVVQIRDGVIAKGNEPLPWIAEYFEETPTDPLDSFSISQVKEKFGGLRFYWSCDVKGSPYHEVWGAVNLATSMSFRTCEVCGQPGNCGRSKNSNWIQTLCATHLGGEKKDAV